MLSDQATACDHTGTHEVVTLSEFAVATEEESVLEAAVRSAMTEARAAQARWAATPVHRRLIIATRWRHLLAQNTQALVHTVAHLPYRRATETLVAEVLPLADACRFLEREAPHLLAPRRHGARGRPLWLRGIDLEVRREPFGVVLVIGPGNYPLLLPGIHTLQALVAGNAVVLKPGVGGTEAALTLRNLWCQAGLDTRLFAILPETPLATQSVYRQGVDKVVLTGSFPTGVAVLRDLAPEVTPAVCELSGCDAVFVLADADLDLVTAALTFGLQFNRSETCIAPRRVFVHQSRLPDLEQRLHRIPLDRVLRSFPSHLMTLITQAIAAGAHVVGDRPQQHTMYMPLILSDVAPSMPLLQADIREPLLTLVPVRNEQEALAAAAYSPYALGAAVFGQPHTARRFAQEVQAGVVLINDVIVPSADPRLPFAGRKHSGFGVTRGAEGLLELTQIKAISSRRGRWYPHFAPAHPADVDLFRSYIACSHGGTWRMRLRGLVGLVRAIAKRR